MESKYSDLVKKFSELPLTSLNEYVWKMDEESYAVIANWKRANGDTILTHCRSATGELMGIPIQIEISPFPEPVLVNKLVDDRGKRNRISRIIPLLDTFAGVETNQDGLVISNGERKTTFGYDGLDYSMGDYELAGWITDAANKRLY